MAPKHKNLMALFKKEPEAPHSPVATPDSKQSIAEETPDAPKRRKLAEGVAVAVAGAEAKTDSPSKPVVTVTGVVSDSGPMSIWNVAPGPDKASLASTAYDPELRAAEFPTGKPIGFALFSNALELIEELKGSGKGSRKGSIVVLSNMFRTLLYLNPKDLIPAVYILTNKVAPDYELDSELGIGDGTLIKAMCEVFGRTESHMKNSMISGECADLGEVALQSRQSQKMLMMPPKLTIAKVFAEMKAIAATSGKGGQNEKKDKIKKMLAASRDAEAKYIVRMLQAKLRIGIATPTVMQAIAYAFALTPPQVVLGGDRAISDVRKVKPFPSFAEMDSRLSAMEVAVKQAFCEMPNFDKVLGALLSGCDAKSLPGQCHISLGIPVKPMLAKPTKGLTEVAERLGGKRYTGEYKYDGERAQIHVVNRETILIYSRNSENMTQKYPDVVQMVKDNLADGVESCIIDSELVAFDQISKKILPFQILSTRGKKNVAVADIKVNVCIYPFDCMLFNGTPLVKESLEARREKLWSILREAEGNIIFAIWRNFEGLHEEEIQAFLDESIAASCEGLMLKTLTENATYEPSRRSLNWLKLKKDYMDGAIGDSIDVVPIGAFHGRGKRSGTYGAYLLAVYDQEAEEYQTVCKAGTGFSDEDLATHYAFFNKGHIIAQAASNYVVNDRVVPDVWLDACQVWEIKAADLSVSPVHSGGCGLRSDGKGIGLRFPRFLRIRDDKGVEDATSAEQIIDMFQSQACISKDKEDDDDY